MGPDEIMHLWPVEVVYGIVMAVTFRALFLCNNKGLFLLFLTYRHSSSLLLPFQHGLKTIYSIFRFFNRTLRLLKEGFAN